ncbi:MAG TPA: hypothetical protein VLX92_07765 [Kofleriaceae bacterium]|nr:hypothetical protein [Kofleriaceae bacterium]
MIRALVIACALCAATVARADDTFESKAQGAERVRHVANVVWALTAPCDRGDDTEQRQCRHVRDERVTELAGQTLLVEAGPGAFSHGEWNAAKKSVAVKLVACIACAGLEIDGKTWFVTGGAPLGFDGDRPRAQVLYDNALGFADETAARAWLAGVGNARVELLVKVPAKPRWPDSGRPGLALDVVGFRVIAPCDGSVVIARPPSSPVAPDPRRCIPGHAMPEVAAVDDLTAELVKDAMKPVRAAIDRCYDSFKVKGQTRLKVSIASDGSIASFEQSGDFDGTPTAGCIADAVHAKLHFPHINKPKVTFAYPIVLP